MPSGVYDHKKNPGSKGKHWKMSKDTRRKMSESHKGKNTNKKSEGHKIKLSKSHTGKHPSEETKRKIGISNFGEKNAWFGLHHSEETKTILSKKTKAYWLTLTDKEKEERNIKVFKSCGIKPNKLEIDFDKWL